MQKVLEWELGAFKQCCAGFLVFCFLLNIMFNWFCVPDIVMKIVLMWLYQHSACLTSDTIAWLSAFSSLLLFLGIKEMLLNIFNGLICFMMWFGHVLVLNEFKNWPQRIWYGMGVFLGMIYGFHIFPYVSVGKEKKSHFLFLETKFLWRSFPE